ncbi:VanZ family protein [Streptomyces sp. NPDC088360]|uniref:VanZ family protein n=1 Tax=Streptomyces sp. NPDC088360 TaxID=3154515 RepID=UPI00344C5DF3
MTSPRPRPAGTPLGLFAYAAARRPSALTIVVGCSALSAGIEAVQFVMNAGRVVDVGDVIFNTVGGLVGCLLAAGAWLVTGRGTEGARHGPPRSPYDRPTSPPLHDGARHR